MVQRVTKSRDAGTPGRRHAAACRCSGVGARPFGHRWVSFGVDAFSRFAQINSSQVDDLFPTAQAAHEVRLTTVLQRLCRSLTGLSDSWPSAMKELGE